MSFPGSEEIARFVKTNEFPEKLELLERIKNSLPGKDKMALLNVVLGLPIPGMYINIDGHIAIPKDPLMDYEYATYNALKAMYLSVFDPEVVKAAVKPLAEAATGRYFQHGSDQEKQLNELRSAHNVLVCFCFPAELPKLRAAVAAQISKCWNGLYGWEN